jgi:hypothetical protein
LIKDKGAPALVPAQSLLRNPVHNAVRNRTSRVRSREKSCME